MGSRRGHRAAAASPRRPVGRSGCWRCSRDRYRARALRSSRTGRTGHRRDCGTVTAERQPFRSDLPCGRVAERVGDPLRQPDPRVGTAGSNPFVPDQLIGLADDVEPASQVTRSWQPDHVCYGSPDSIKSVAEIGGFRAHDGREIAKNGHLSLDQEIEGSNPSSPAKPQHLGSSDSETTRYCGSELDRRSRRGGSAMRSSPDSTPVCSPDSLGPSGGSLDFLARSRSGSAPPSTCSALPRRPRAHRPGPLSGTG